MFTFTGGKWYPAVYLVDPVVFICQRLDLNHKEKDYSHPQTRALIIPMVEPQRETRWV